MERFVKLKTTRLKVGSARVIAASPDVLSNQRRIGKRHTLEVYNAADVAVAFGGPDVTLETGVPIFPNERRMFPVVDTDAIYLIADKEADVVIAEYCV